MVTKYSLRQLTSFIHNKQPHQFANYEVVVIIYYNSAMTF